MAYFINDDIVFQTYTNDRQGNIDLFPAIESTRSEEFALLPEVTSVGSANIGPSTFPLPSPDPGVHISPTLHTDYHYRLWAIPPVIQLSNPALNSDFPFRLWNTYPNSETLQSIVVDESEVLSFTASPGDVFHDGQYLETFFRIGAGEANIDTNINFNTESGTGILRVIAAVSDTFNLIPDVPISESWQYLTDIITTHNGVEQRISLRRLPRIHIEYDVDIINQRQRREQYEKIKKNILVKSLVPFYQYATPVTGKSVIGQDRVYFNPKLSNLKIGQFVMLIDPSSENFFLSTVESTTEDGCILKNTLGIDVAPPFIILPAFNCLLNNGMGIKMDTITGTLSVKADSMDDPEVLRADQPSGNVEELSGLPILNRRPLPGAEENFSYERDIIDNEVGRRDLRSSYKHAMISGDRKFIVQRTTDLDDFDYWREFFDRVKGSWQPFLLSTYFPDLTLLEDLDDAASSMLVKEDYYVNDYFPFETWRHVQMEWPGRVLTNHRISNAQTTDEGALLEFIPNLPLGMGPRPLSIAYLQKVRAGDTIRWNHYANYSEVTIGVFTTDEG